MEKGTLKLTDGTPVCWSLERYTPGQASARRKAAAQSTYLVTTVWEEAAGAATACAYRVPGCALNTFLNGRGQTRAHGECVLTVALADGVPLGPTEFAYHEAAHAVASCRLDLGFSCVVVYEETRGGEGGQLQKPEWWWEGQDDFPPHPVSRKSLVDDTGLRRAYDQLIVLLAGPLALRRHLLLNGERDGQALGTTVAQAGRGDQQIAHQYILKRIHFDSVPCEVEFRDAAEMFAQRLVRDNWQAIARVAEALVNDDKKRLTQEQVKAELEALRKEQQ